MTLRILGTDVAVDSDDDQIVQLLGLLWRSLVVVDAVPPDVTIRVRSDGERVRVVREPSGGSFDGWEGATEELWPLMLTIRYVLGEIATDRADEGVVVHAAVAARDGAAVLLVGPNGTGKTTLVLQMLREGWAYLSDDLAPIGSDGSVLPFPKPLGIRGEPGRWEELFSLWDPPEWVPAPAGGFLIPAHVFQIADGPRRPKAIVFPVYDKKAPAEGAFEELSGAQALANLGEQTNRVDPASLRALSFWMRGLSVFRVRYSSAARVLPALELRTL